MEFCSALVLSRRQCPPGVALSYLSDDDDLSEPRTLRLSRNVKLAIPRRDLSQKCVHCSSNAMELSCYSWVSSSNRQPSVSCRATPDTPTLCLAMQIKLIQNDTGVDESQMIFLSLPLPQSMLHQKKRQKRNSTIMEAIPAMGPYCLRSSSQLMRTAARLYLAESSRSRLLMSPILSRLSPR